LPLFLERQWPKLLHLVRFDQLSSQSLQLLSMQKSFVPITQELFPSFFGSSVRCFPPLDASSLTSIERLLQPSVFHPSFSAFLRPYQSFLLLPVLQFFPISLMVVLAVH